VNVLVLGATSGVGESLALEFASGNHVSLCGRQAGRLDAVAAGCRGAGAMGARIVAADLSAGTASLLAQIGSDPVDLCFNAASATSGLRDGDVDLRRLRACAEVDFFAPLDLVLALRQRQPAHPPRTVFISSVLAGLPSPDRDIYGSLKRLQEASLRQAAALWPGLDVRVIRVGKLLATGPASADTSRLARFARQLLDGNRRLATWGATGRALEALFCLQPLAFQAVMALRRRTCGRNLGREPV
jgi:short-subunit dehydrogenase